MINRLILKKLRIATTMAQISPCFAARDRDLMLSVASRLYFSLAVVQRMLQESGKKKSRLGFPSVLGN